ncbi:dimethyl sulfoxide reductase anchor subunit [Providencia rettgeri]|uniref:dimethyl sulfoxide reductase anchor subunit family protein n=1 Tax=Providencia TaxID=586 RepID=UPI0005B3A2E7|nr:MULTISPECIES: DmsC/YnfH family molybdoenzyme membrane anchor subunit [Providencia]APC11752.1 Anaerobic dimethyl sulfoxide reductase chain C [Providencia rettgeri]AVL75086.1 diguanylate cyclase [Providencia rettgeri]EIL1982104.1 dimethyl sulfoxide reductase anchor subunit [Providencia rettgeri]EIU9513727.1 dimethyl sulfoxide reductase anchor subunit [Providencia rettgeri]EJD6041508.1 dimethyl sulfoxide reductase anchor subunit [Providencia rettgeri]
MHELPLVFFTVLGQSAAGLYLLAYLSKKIGMVDEYQLRNANIVAFITMIIALALGALHVGQPLRFFNMLLGVGRSPMSNEALLSGIFVAFGAATLLFTLFIKNKVLSELCNIGTVIFGLAFVWSIPQVYNIATVANWFTVFTTLQMWMTLLVGGGALAILLGAQRLGALAFLIGAVIIFATRAAYVSFLGETGPEISAEQAGFWSFQLVVLALMLFVFPALLYRGRNSTALLGICAIAVILAELSGRIAFYNLWQITM